MLHASNPAHHAHMDGGGGTGRCLAAIAAIVVVVVAVLAIAADDGVGSGGKPFGFITGESYRGEHPRQAACESAHDLAQRGKTFEGFKVVDAFMPPKPPYRLRTDDCTCVTVGQWAVSGQSRTWLGLLSQCKVAFWIEKQPPQSHREIPGVDYPLPGQIGLP